MFLSVSSSNEKSMRLHLGLLKFAFTGADSAPCTVNFEATQPKCGAFTSINY